MEKELFIALCDQLKNKVPELRWIDSDQGQLNVSERASGGLPLLPGRDELPAMHDPHGRKTTRACEISTASGIQRLGYGKRIRTARES